MFAASCHSLLRDGFSSLYLRPMGQASLNFVRWRKRRDRPRAKSKFFVVRQPTHQPPEEREELLLRTQRYNTTMKAISKMFKEEFQARGASAGTMSKLEASEYEDSYHREMMKVNEEWNAEVARNREIRVAKELLDTRALLSSLADQGGQKALEELLVKEEEVREVKERGKDFITAENLDEKIEELLNTKVNYNFAIDLEGNQHQPKKDLFHMDTDEMDAPKQTSR